VVSQVYRVINEGMGSMRWLGGWVLEQKLKGDRIVGLEQRPSDPKKHGNAYQVYQLQIWVKGKKSVPEDQQLVKGKFPAKEKADPTTGGVISIVRGVFGG